MVCLEMSHISYHNSMLLSPFSSHSCLADEESPFLRNRNNSSKYWCFQKPLNTHNMPETGVQESGISRHPPPTMATQASLEYCKPCWSKTKGWGEQGEWVSAGCKPIPSGMNENTLLWRTDWVCSKPGWTAVAFSVTAATCSNLPTH